MSKILWKLKSTIREVIIRFLSLKALLASTSAIRNGIESIFNYSVIRIVTGLKNKIMVTLSKRAVITTNKSINGKGSPFTVLTILMVTHWNNSDSEVILKIKINYIYWRY